MGEIRGVYRVLVWKPEGKRQLGRLRRRWEDNMKMDLYIVHSPTNSLLLILEKFKIYIKIHILNQMSKDYNLKISTDKTKIMTFKGKNLVRSKIEIDGSILEQVKKLIISDLN